MNIIIYLAVLIADFALVHGTGWNGKMLMIISVVVSAMWLRAQKNLELYQNYVDQLEEYEND